MYKVEGESLHPNKLWYTNYSSRFLAGERWSQCKHTVHIAAPFFHKTVADYFISIRGAVLHLFK